MAVVPPFVFVSSEPSITWQKADVVRRILENLGGQVCVTGASYSGKFKATLRCAAPDETIATSLRMAIEGYLERKSQLNPWINFWNGRAPDKNEGARPDLGALQTIDLARIQATKNFEIENGVSLKDLKRALMVAQHKQDDLQSQKLRAELEALEAQLDEITPRVSEQEDRELLHASIDLEAEGTVSQEGLTLKIDLWYIYDIGQFVPAIIGYLQANGCDNVRCLIEYVMF